MIASALIALLAAAAAPGGSLVPKQKIVAEYATCLVRNAPNATQRLLVTELGSTAEARLAREVSLAGRSCLKGRPVLTLQTGAIAEAAFAREPALLATARALPVAAPMRPEAVEGRAFAIGYATCLVARDPVRSVELIGTGIATAEERSVFVGYGEALELCMPEKVRYQVDITDMRNHVAAALYQAAARGRAGD